MDPLYTAIYICFAFLFIGVWLVKPEHIRYSKKSLFIMLTLTLLIVLTFITDIRNVTQSQKEIFLGIVFALMLIAIIYVEITEPSKIDKIDKPNKPNKPNKRRRYFKTTRH